MFNLYMRLLLIFGIFILSTQFANAQFGKKTSNSGEDSYFKYEREEVGNYRDRVDFQLPEPTIVPVEVNEETPDAIRLSYLFPPGTKLYIDAEDGLKQMIEKDIRIKENTKTIPGYRIQAYTGASRSGATKQKNSLMGQFPKHISYLKYEMPNYIILVGDFMDKEEATLFCRQLRVSVPGAFVVPDQVQVPRYRPEEEEEFDENGFPILPERNDNNNRN